MKIISHLQKIILVCFFLFSHAILAANPASPFLPSDNVQDPNCLPTDSNCYVLLTSFQNETVTGLDYATSTGILSLTAGYVIPTTASTTAWNSAIGALGSSALIQNGNSFGTTLTLGTNDDQALSFKTNGISRLTIDNAGNINATGTITAGSFYGDGSNLAGIFSTSTTRNVFSASGPLSYSSSTGNFLISQASSTSNGYLSSADFAIFSAKENAIAASSTSTYLRGDKTFATLDTSAVLNFSTTTRGLLSSSATGLSYSTTTGVFSLTAGYNIPTTASTTAWENAATTLASNIFFSGGNVGIGTTTPNSKLNIYGSIDIVQLAVRGTSGQSSALQTWTDGSNVTGTFYSDGGNGTSLQIKSFGATQRTSFATYNNSNQYSELGFTGSTYSAGVGSAKAFVRSSTGSLYVTDASMNLSNIFSSGMSIGGSSSAYGTPPSNGLIVQGNVGIGTTNPATRLAVNSGTTNVNTQIDGTSLSFTRTADGAATAYIKRTGTNGLMEIQGYDGIIFRTTGSETERMRIDTTGNVGIGTTNPGSALEVAGTTGLSWTANSSSSGLATIGSATGGSLFVRTPAVNSGFSAGLGVDGTYAGGISVVNLSAYGTKASGIYGSALAFNTTNGTSLIERMRIDTNGNVGIGTSTPLSPLHVAPASAPSGNVFLRFDYPGTSQNTLFTMASGNLGITPSGGRTDFSGDITTTGTVLAGTNSFLTSTVPLQVRSRGTGNIASIIRGFAGQTADLTQWQDSNGNALTVVTATGNVGIGTTTPQSILTISGSNALQTFIPATNSDTTGISFTTIGGATERAFIKTNIGTGEMKIGGGTGGYFPTFYSNGSEAMRISTAGNVGIGTTTPGSVLTVAGTSAFTGTMNLLGSVPTLNFGTGGTEYMTSQYGSLNIFGGSAGNGIILNGGGNGFKIQNSKAFVGFVNNSLVNSFGVNGNASIGSTYSTTTAPTNGLIVEGNVGIGTTTPNAKLNVYGTTRLDGNLVLGNGGYVQLEPTGAQYIDASNSSAAFNLNASQYFILKRAGSSFAALGSGLAGASGSYLLDNFGIGTTTVSSRLSVQGSGSTSGTSAFDISNSLGTSLLFARNDGNIGINTTSPTGTGSTTLQIAGTGGGVNQYGSLSLSNASNSGGNFAGSIDYYTQGNLISAIRSIQSGGGNTGSLYFYTAGAGGTMNRVMELSSAGKLVVGSTVGLVNTGAQTTIAANSFGGTVRGLNIDNNNTGANSNSEFGFTSINGSGAGVDIAVLRGIKSDATAGAEIGQLALYTRNAGTLQESVRFAGNGNVGIGTTTPGSKLDVWGNLSVGTSSTAALFVNSGTKSVGINTSSAGAGLQINASAAGSIGQIIKGAASQSADFLQMQDSGGSVKLYVSSDGSVISNGNIAGAAYWFGGAAAFGSFARSSGTAELTMTTQNASSANFGIQFGNAANTFWVKAASSQTGNMQEWRNSAGTALALVTASGSFGIGTTTPADKLQVAGDIRVGISGANGCIKDFSGTVITGTCSSDERLKTNVVDLSDGYLDKMANLRVITYNWNDTARDLNKVDTTVTNYGLLAQNVEETFPELVTTDSNGYKQVNYSRLPLYLLKSVQELSKKFEKVYAWFANDKFNVQNDVCVDDYCVTKAQFKQMLINSQNGNASTYVPPVIAPVITEPTPEPTPEVVPDQAPAPTPEPVVETPPAPATE